MIFKFLIIVYIIYNFNVMPTKNNLKRSAKKKNNLNKAYQDYGRPLMTPLVS